MDRKARMFGRFVWVGSFSTEPTVGTMTSRFNVHNLTSSAADGMSLASRETLIA